MEIEMRKVGGGNRDRGGNGDGVEQCVMVEIDSGGDGDGVHEQS